MRLYFIYKKCYYITINTVFFYSILIKYIIKLNIKILYKLIFYYVVFINIMVYI